MIIKLASVVKNYKIFTILANSKIYLFYKIIVLYFDITTI